MICCKFHRQYYQKMQIANNMDIMIMDCMDHMGLMDYMECHLVEIDFSEAIVEEVEEDADHHKTFPRNYRILAI